VEYTFYCTSHGLDGGTLGDTRTGKGYILEHARS